MSFILHGMTAMQDKMSSFDTVKSLMQKQTLKGSQRTQTGSGYDHHKPLLEPKPLPLLDLCPLALRRL